MGGVIEGGVDIADKTSPRRSAIEKAQAELRLKYETRDKTKRELEFLLEGGDPLELEFANAASVSVQSTSFTDQHPDQFVTSEAKGSFAFTASPYGDSVESSGRLGINPCEPNSADNLLLFDVEREFSEGSRSKLHPTKSNIVSSENLSNTDGNRRTGEHGNSAAFGLPRKAYKRRYRSRPNRDGTRSSSTDVNPTRGSHGSSLPSRHGPRDDKGLISDVENRIISTNLKSEPASLAEDALHQTGLMDNQQDIELDGIKAVESTKDLTTAIPVNAASDAIACETPLDDQRNQQSRSGVLKTPVQMDSDEPEAIQAMEGMASENIGCQPGVSVVEVENKTSCQVNGFVSKKGDRMKNDAHNNSASCGMKGLDSESSCSQTSLSIGGNNDTDMCTKMRSTVSNGQIKDKSSIPEKILEGDESVKENKETGGMDSSSLLNAESSFACHSQQEDGVKLQPEEELNRSGSALKNDLKDQIVIEGVETCRLTGSESGRKSADPLGDEAGPNNGNSCTVSVRHEDSIDVSLPDLPGGASLMRASTVSLEAQTSSRSDLKLGTEIDEESILKEAQIIETKRKRIAELSVATAPKRIRLKSHWDYVLEEMAWLANDFAQERVWKITAASQISSRAAFTCQLRKQESNFHLEAKKVAHTLAKSVTQFWQLVEETSKVLDEQSQIDDEHSVQAYAVRFRKYNNCSIVYNQAEVPRTPDRVSDMGIIDPSWKDNLTEENLFYRVLPGTMETYRSSVESHVAQFQTIKSGVLEEVETSAFDAAADFESQDNAYVEERETNTYGASMAFEDSKSSRFGQKKQKHLIHAYGVRSHEVSSDISHMQGAENKVAHQFALLEKRPGGNLDASIPTKRVRTASRRVVSPFSAGTSAFLQAPNKTDASSGDTTNSFQDDQSTLRGASHAPYSLEVESAGKFEKQLSIESAEVPIKHRKKKKAKHLNAAYEPRWQVDPTFQDGQFPRDHSRKSHHLESNCSSGNTCSPSSLLGQPMAKKPKTMRQSQDNSFENITPIGGSVSSPAASQMSNMTNPNKFIKMLGGRDRGRKPKGLKVKHLSFYQMPDGQPGSGSSWTLFEDQALVVLAHDLGPNWELVSDAINSTLQFKCIFRKAKECKERHNFLMDRTSGDGADSAEDSGSSQPYPSTLPGIPKGSARQLFQRLQGPMEEDTLKSHFEKIIIIGQKQLYRKSQDPKELQQPHSSHTVALSQVCPNNLNGGPILTPLDLCEASTIAGTDMLPLGYQGPHSGSLALPNQGTATPMHPASGACSGLQGSPSMIVGSNLSSSPSSLNSSARDARYGLPRSASLSADEQQQRMQQYNQMISNRSVPQPNASACGALPGTERSARMLPGGNGMGLASGVNKSMPMVRPGFQSIASPPIVNSGSMVSPGMPPANIHSGVGPGQGSSVLRPREPLHMMRPGLGQDSLRPMMPDLQMQASPRNSQMPHFGGLSSPFPHNQTAPSPVPPSYALHHQPSHPMSPQQPQVLASHLQHFPGPAANHTSTPQQQAYTMHLAKDRQHRFASSNSLTPHHHIQPQPQLPVSSPLQSNSAVQTQTGSPTVSLSPLKPSSVKQQAPALRNAPAGGNGLTNQTSKQRQRHFSQANRQHPQQRQPQQSGKAAKGVGRGNSMMHQNVSIDHSLVNGVSTSQGQFASPQSSNKSLPQQKKNSVSSAKHLHQMTTHTDNTNQVHVPAVAPSQPASSLVTTSSKAQGPQQTPSHQKLVNQNQRVVQSNRQVNSDPSNKSQTSSDQRQTSSSAEMDSLTTALPQATSGGTNAAQIGSEPLLDPNSLNSATNTNSLVSMPSNTSELAAQDQGLGKRQLSANLPSNIAQSQQQLASVHSQQQAQLLQAENGNLYGRPSDHRLE